MTDAAQALEAALAGVARLDRTMRAELVARIVADLAAGAADDAASVRAAALRLKPAERAELARQLLLSLAALPEEQLAATWAVESQRRAGQAG